MGKKLPLVLEKKVAGEKNGTHLLIKTPRVVGGAITLRHYLSHIPANKLASTPTPWKNKRQSRLDVSLNMFPLPRHHLTINVTLRVTCR